MSRSNRGSAYSGIGTPGQFRWARIIVYCVLILNLLDAMFTIAWIDFGLAREVNPFLKSLVVDSPLLFVLAKVALVGLGSWLLWRYRRHRLAIVGIFVAFLVYYWLLLYHLRYLAGLVRNSFFG